MVSWKWMLVNLEEAKIGGNRDISMFCCCCYERLWNQNSSLDHKQNLILTISLVQLRRIPGYKLRQVGFLQSLGSRDGTKITIKYEWLGNQRPHVEKNCSYLVHLEIRNACWLLIDTETVLAFHHCEQITEINTLMKDSLWFTVSQSSVSDYTTLLFLSL